MTEKKTTPRKRKPAKKDGTSTEEKTPATEEDRIISAYYMMAQVVEHNTMMMKALIDMILIKEGTLAEAPTEPDVPFVPVEAIGDDKLKTMLKSVYDCAGKETAMKLLASHNAEKISELDNAMKEAFVECARQIIKQKTGAMDERQ